MATATKKAAAAKKAPAKKARRPRRRPGQEGCGEEGAREEGRCQEGRAGEEGRSQEGGTGEEGGCQEGSSTGEEGRGQEGGTGEEGCVPRRSRRRRLRRPRRPLPRRLLRRRRPRRRHAAAPAPASCFAGCEDDAEPAGSLAVSDGQQALIDCADRCGATRLRPGLFLLARAARSEAERRPVDDVVLAAALGDLERAEAVAQLGAARQRPAALQAVQQRAAQGVAAAGRVDHRGRPRTGGTCVRSPSIPDLAALGAERDDQALHVPARQRLERLSRCGRTASCLRSRSRATQLACSMKCAQLVAVEHRQALARIEDERDAGRGELLRHAAASRRGRPAR